MFCSMSLNPTDPQASRLAKQSQRCAREVVVALVLTLAAAAVVIAAVSG